MSKPSLSSSASSSLAIAGVCAAIVLPFVVACQRGEDSRTVGQKIDGVIATTEQATVDAKASAQASADSTKAAIREVVDQTATAVQDATAKFDASAEDAAITASVSAGLVKDPDLSAIKIDVDTKGGVVSLYGPAPSESARSRASVIEAAVKGVIAVENKLTVKTS